MKKIFYSLLAVAALASCAKTDAVYEDNQTEIKIKPATALATKANVTAAIDGTEYPVRENFDVYGYWANQPAGSSFTNATDEVTVYLGEGGAYEFTNKGAYWGGTTTYYWPKNGSLRFAAYSPSSVDMDHDLDTDTYTLTKLQYPNNTAETYDLLVAPTSKSYTAMTAAENVSVVFEHALSWITVKVVAKDAEAAKAFDIKKVTINDVVNVADFTAVMSGEKSMTWDLTDTTVPYVVYEGSQAVTETATVIETTKDGTVIIPQPTTSITVDYKQNALEGTPALDNQTVTVDLVLDAENTPWKPGKHYVYTLVFGLDEILINPDVVDWDDVVVNEIQVGKTNIYSAEQLAAALTADAENIEVVLFDDIDLPISSLGQITGGSGEYKLAGENTKNITIDLNGKTLNVTTTYWSVLGAKNNDAIITIKNGTMTSSQASGTWNSYDLCFANCNYVFEDVVFEKAIALEGKNYTLKSVTINETHDYYAMWISAKGQNVTIDGLTVNSDGRGIKIDEQYVSAPAHVTLNVANAEFNTVKKAAIVVKSVAGATVNLENVDITNVAADADFTVWVDENSAEHAEKVIVKGGLCKVENGDATTVHSAADLSTLAEMINDNADYAEMEIVLGSDIDLATLAPATRSALASNWTPVGTSENPFKGTFDGNGYTIKNLALVETEAKEGKAYIGFFGYAQDATIKNVTFENVYINIPCLDIDHSQGHIGAVAGSLEGTSTIENVTVKGDITVYTTQTANGASRVAVVAGGNTYGNVTMKNVHVIANEGSSLIANNNVGALAGQLQNKMYFENCSSNINVTANKFFAGGLVGIAAGDSKFVNCHTTGDVAVVAGREGRHNDEYRVGGIAGGWADGKTKVCTLENCSYTGKVSGINSDGTVATPLDYMGYVGRGYTLANCAGSKVVIDGTEFVQKYDNVYGVYTVNGLTPVATADELVAALEAKEGVLFMNDIKIEPAKMSNAYGATGVNVKNGQTIDGNGYTLNIKGAGGTWDSGINTTGGVIKNLTVTGSFRGIFINHTGNHSEKVVLENVTIGGNGTVYTISCDQGLYQGIEATNCTFNGWTSFAKTAGEAKFINCSFGEGSGYKYCRPYSNTEFVNCTFCPGYAVDQTRATVTFTDCTWE